MSVTIHTFPPIQSMESSRSFALAFIVLLHLGFFWALTSGLSTRIVAVLAPNQTHVVNVKPVEPVEPVQRTVDVDLSKVRPMQPLFVPRPHSPDIATEHTEMAVTTTTDVNTGSANDIGPGSVNPPIIEQPRIDSSLPLSEPEYPPNEIRLGHAGTVTLSVLVLENGRVADARIEQSSGYARLDAAAQREALRWRMKPGTQDGRPFAMWKTIPITFQLKK